MRDTQTDRDNWKTCCACGRSLYQAEDALGAENGRSYCSQHCFAADATEYREPLVWAADCGTIRPRPRRSK